jgi:hypothetical protein
LAFCCESGGRRETLPPPPVFHTTVSSTCLHILCTASSSHTHLLRPCPLNPLPHVLSPAAARAPSPPALLTHPGGSPDQRQCGQGGPPSAGGRRGSGAGGGGGPPGHQHGPGERGMWECVWGGGGKGRDCGRGAVAEKGLPVSVASHICGSVEQQATSPHALVCLHAGGCAPPTQQNM